MGISHSDLWRRYANLAYEDLPDPVRTVAGHCALDWFACALAGSREPLSAILRAEVADVAGPCSLIGTGGRTRATAAALVNGAAGHALDYDDTSTVMGGHPTAPVLPAALAVAEELGVTGARLLTALVVGIEVESRLGAAIGGRHYARGWHVTSSIGVLGATAAAAYLLGLDEAQFGHAMGLAASQASGLKANFGTMTKPFHAGHAAERGLLSARLAARGFTANPDAFAVRQGLVEAAGDGALDGARLGAIDDQWAILHTLFKFHAACYLTHSAIEAAGRIRESVALSDVAAVSVTVHPSLLDICGIPRPETGLQAKFSLTATTAMALLGLDTADPAVFSDPVARRDDLRELLDLVRVETDRGLAQTQTRVEVCDRSQRRHRAEHDSGIPARDLDGQGRRLRGKFQALAGVVLGSGASNCAAALSELAACENVRGLLDAPAWVAGQAEESPMVWEASTP